jgi:hypothetical protein
MFVGIINLSFLAGIMILLWLLFKKPRVPLIKLADEIVVYRSNPRISYLIFEGSNGLYACYKQSTFAGQHKLYTKVGPDFVFHKQALAFVERESRKDTNKDIC